jgi:hypothetical protein
MLRITSGNRVEYIVHLEPAVSRIKCSCMRLFKVSSRHGICLRGSTKSTSNDEALSNITPGSTNSNAESLFLHGKCLLCLAKLSISILFASLLNCALSLRASSVARSMRPAPLGMTSMISWSVPPGGSIQGAVLAINSTITRANSSPQSSCKKWPPPCMRVWGCPLAPGTKF